MNVGKIFNDNLIQFVVLVNVKTRETRKQLIKESSLPLHSESIITLVLLYSNPLFFPSLSLSSTQMPNKILHFYLFFGTGEIDKTNANRYSTSLAFTSQLLTSEVSGFTVVKENMVSSRTNFKYSYNGGRQHQFALNTKMKDSSSGYNKRYSVNT